MTGAPVPEGADAVLPFEWMDADDDRAVVRRLPHRDRHVVEPGAHLRRGDPVLAAGAVVAPAALGALASAGCAVVRVAVRPRVAVLGTGSELVAAEEAPGPGRIRNSNAAMLAGQVLRAGAVPRDLGFVRDDEEELRAAVRKGLEADVLLVSGGVSAGDKDLVPDAFAAEGVERVFHRWAVQPGGPLWFGVRGETLVFGLPGNPAGTFVGCELLVVPALATRVGREMKPRATLVARYEGTWGRPAPRRRFRPARLATDADGTLHAHPLPWRGSGDPFGLAAGEALVEIPEGREPPAEGPARLRVVPISEAAVPWGQP
jgi:molybdopterin molybdotransferase